MCRDYARPRLRALCDRLCQGGRVTSRDESIVSCVPRYRLETRRGRVRGRDVLEVRIKVPGAWAWSPWLTAEQAARRLRDAGFVDAAINRLAIGAPVESGE